MRRDRLVTGCSMTTRDSLGWNLRSERERRGITLEAIAQSTKIRPSLLAALESGDVSKLPGGIFRRAFLRAYAAAIGVPPEPLVAEFSRLFPEPGAASESDSSASDLVHGEMRLTLEPEPSWRSAAGRQGLAAVADTSAVLLLAGAIALLTGGNQWVLGGAIGLVYYALATAFLGRSPASWYLTRGWLSRRGGRPALQSRQRATLKPRWLADLVWRPATPVARAHLDSSLESSTEHVSAHSHPATTR